MTLEDLLKRTKSVGDCLEWTGSRDNHGYGQVFYQGKSTRAHRVALALTLGNDIPPGMMACHHCDNPPCINPAHLFLGTGADNMRDAMRKGRLRLITSAQTHFKSGRAPYGERASGAKLTEQVAIEVLAKGSFWTRYKVSLSGIRDIEIGSSVPSRWANMEASAATIWVA